MRIDDPLETSTMCPIPPARVPLAYAFALGLVVGLSGCSGGGGRAAPVDPPRAREALVTALDSWKKGEKPEALKEASPSIVVQDFDWMAIEGDASLSASGFSP